MKKLLSLLSVLTISGSAIPTTIAASPYNKYEINNNQHNNNDQILFESLDRNKRGVDDGNEFTGGNGIYGSFKPDLWEEIIREKYFSYSLSDFKNRFKEKVKNYRDNKHDFSEWVNEVTDYYIDKFSEGIWNNWETLLYSWKNSSKLNRIRIVTYWSGTFYSVNLRTDDKVKFENKYLNKQIMNETIINNNLGIIYNYSDFSILSAFKNLNPSLDISQLEVTNKNKDSAVIIQKNHYLKDNFSSVKINYIFENNLNNIIKKTQLGKINNNSDLTILNELNYLNPDLDISQLEIKEKDDISATIKPKNNTNKYIEEKKIFYKISNKEINVIDLNELIKKAIFFKFRDDNPDLIFKEIKEVNSSEIIYEKKAEIDRILDTINIPEKNICSVSLELPILEYEQTYNSPSCKIVKENTTTYQVTKGIVTTEGIETNKEKSSTFSKEAHGDFELGFSTKAKVGGSFLILSEFESEINSKTSVGGSETNSNTETNSEKIIKLKKIDNTTNDTKEEKETTEIDIPSQPIRVLPNKQVKTSIIVNKTINKIILKLNQEIYGPIGIIIFLTDNSTYSFNFSIKEAMQKLEKFGILPEEIVINKNESITFNGKMSVTQSETGYDVKLIVINN